MIASQRDSNGMTYNALHNAPLLSASEFSSRVQEGLTLDVLPGLDDRHVNPVALRARHRSLPSSWPSPVRPIRPAAVLVPIIERDKPSGLFTQRTAHLADHHGLVSRRKG